MAAAESVRKLVSLGVIALLIGASAWLQAPPAQDHRAGRAAAAQPQTELASPDPAPVPPPPLSSRYPADENVLPAPRVVRSESVQSRFRVDSEPRPALVAVFADDGEKLRVRERDGTAEPGLLAAAVVPLHAFEAPGVERTRVATSSSHGVVSGAFGTAARQTGNAFRIAGRAIRTAF